MDGRKKPRKGLRQKKDFPKFPIAKRFEVEGTNDGKELTEEDKEDKRKKEEEAKLDEVGDVNEGEEPTEEDKEERREQAEKDEEKEIKREKEEKQRYERLLGEIRKIPESDPSKSEGQVRQLEKMISTFHNSELKDQLLHELNGVSCRGLGDDLKTMVENTGLASEALTLVSKFLTTVPELAEHLYLTSKDVLNGEGLGMVKRRLGPNLEVLGGLKARGIDITKPWVKRLTDKVPSLHSLSRLSAEELESLCTTPDEPKKAEEPPNSTDAEGSGKPTESEDEGEMASKGELEVVRQLGKVAEAYNRQTSAVPPDLKLPSENPDTKAVDEEKLRKAKELMNEAKAMATEQSEEAKKATKEKMAEMMEVLELPSDWCKQDTVDTPEQLLKDLGGIIDQYSSIAEAAESYKNDLEVVAKASGGRALRGIYYSKYASPQTAGRPVILMPSNVTLTNPDDAMKIKCLKFQESRAAANYVHTVKSSSTSIGFAVAGFYGGFVGEVKGAYSTEEHRDETRSAKTYSTSASVLQFIWTAKKCFQIEQEQMKLAESAKLMANCISKVSEKDAEKRKATARRFMEMFGSHVPAGVQTLGGVFFSIADAESEGVQKTTTLTKTATEKLQAQMSFGFLGGAFGIGGSVKAEHQESTGETQAEQEDQKTTSYTYTVHAMGPAATNPVVFQKLLSYNSTWALIDRGPHEAYIPIWELLRNLGGSYEDAAQVLEATWDEEEETKKEVSKQLKKMHDKRRKKEDVRKELEELSKEYQAREPEKDYGFWPSNGKMCYSAFKLTKEQAYGKAIQLVMKDPHLNICELYLRNNDDANPVYTLKCWEADYNEEMTFGKSEGYHVLFYSATAFKWRGLVPVKAKCDD